MLQGVWKTNLMKSKIDINFRAKMLLWQLKYDSLPCFFSFSFFVFSGGSILYTNLVVMIRSLGTSLRVGVFSLHKSITKKITTITNILKTATCHVSRPMSVVGLHDSLLHFEVLFVLTHTSPVCFTVHICSTLHIIILIIKY